MVSNPQHFPFPFFYLRLEQCSCTSFQIDPSVSVLHLPGIGREPLHQTPGGGRIVAIGESDFPSPRDFTLGEGFPFGPLQQLRQVGGHGPVHRRVDHVLDPSRLSLILYEPIQDGQRLAIEAIDRVRPVNDPQLFHFVRAPHNVG